MIFKTFMLKDAGIEALSCTDKNVVKALEFLSTLLYWAKVIVPLILIVTGIVTLAKAVISDAPDFSKEIRSLAIRVFIGVMVFFLPTILISFIDLVSGSDEVKSDFKQCSKCILDYKSCSSITSSSKK